MDQERLLMNESELDGSHHGLRKTYIAPRVDISGVDVNVVRRLKVLRWTAGSRHFRSQRQYLVFTNVRK